MSSNPKQIPSRRNSLKNATDHLYTDLGESVAALDLTQPVQYRAFLQASAAPLIAIELLLESAGVEEVFPDWPARTRRTALLSDLERLGVPAQPLQLHRPPPSHSEIYGMMYVLEGSRRDAKALLQRVNRSPDLQIRAASTYLQANDSKLWSSFVEKLESPGAAEDPLETTSGAIYTFALFQRAFAATMRQLRI